MDRSTRQVVSAAGALIALALVAVVGIAVRGQGGTDSRAGVPDQVHDVPERMGERDDDGSWARDEVTDDLSLGRGAVAWVTYEGLPVVVDAEEGGYHLLDLPGFVGNDPRTREYASPGLALSPDGRRLAYGYGDPGAEDRPVPSGIRVVDLETGVARSIPLSGGHGTIVRRIQFSADGRWLVWVGSRLERWTEKSIAGAGTVAGRIAPGASRSTRVAVGRPGLSTGDLGVADTGLVVAVSDNGGVQRSAVVQRWDGRPLGRERLVGTDGEPLGTTLQSGVRVSPDGSLVAVGSCCTDDAYVVDAATGAVVTTAALDHDGSLASAEPVGWLDDDTSVWQVMPQGGGGDGSLTLVEADGSARDVGTVEDAVPDGVSVATDPMAAGPPTVERPAPHWPWTTTRWLVLLGGVLALLVVAASAVWAQRRVVLGRSAASGSVPAAPSPRARLVAFTAGAVGSCALSLASMYLYARWADRLDSWFVTVPGAFVVTGVALLFHRRWRWGGIGLVVGALAAYAFVFVLLVAALSSIGS